MNKKREREKKKKKNTPSIKGNVLKDYINKNKSKIKSGN